MGDAAATAHFSVGSGTKLAMESAIALADYLHTEPTWRPPSAATRTSAALEVLRLQNAARNSTEWFEDVERYLASRSGAVQLFAADALAAHQPREPARARPGLAGRRREMVRAAARPARAATPRGRRCSCRSRLRELRPGEPRRASRRWRNTARSTACPTDWHFVHYAERAKGGAGLVFTEMTCVSPRGPHHARLHRPLCARARGAPGSGSSISCTPRPRPRSRIQLGHSGPKGSTQLGWETIGRAARRRQLGGDRRRRRCLVAATTRCRAR